MRADAEPLAEVVRQRADVEAGGAVDAQRDAVAFDANSIDAHDGHVTGAGRQDGRHRRGTVAAVRSRVARADSCAAPSIFFAEYAGGCCRNVPRNASSAAIDRLARRQRALMGRAERPCPRRRSVSVATPSRTTAS